MIVSNKENLIKRRSSPKRIENGKNNFEHMNFVFSDLCNAIQNCINCNIDCAHFCETGTFFTQDVGR